MEGSLPDLLPTLSPSDLSAALLSRSRPPHGPEATGPKFHLSEGDGELKSFPVEPVDTLVVTVIGIEPIEIGIMAVAVPPCATVGDGTRDDQPIGVPVPGGKDTTRVVAECVTSCATVTAQVQAVIIGRRVHTEMLVGSVDRFVSGTQIHTQLVVA